MFRFKLSSLCIAIAVVAAVFGLARWVVVNPEPAGSLGILLLVILIVLACSVGVALLGLLWWMAFAVLLKLL